MLSARQVNPKFEVDEELELKVNQRTQKVASSNINQHRVRGFPGNAAAGDEHEEDMLMRDEDEEQFEDNLVRKGGPGAGMGQKGGNHREQERNKDKNAQQIPLFKGSKYPPQRQGQHSRSDSNFSDLNQVLQQNLNINHVQIDHEGNVNDQNGLGGRGFNEDDEAEANFEGDQDAKDRVRKLNGQVDRYFKGTNSLHEKKQKKEQKGWDMKFQNYWGYLVAADKNLKDSMTLSEKFFDHIGNFRKTCHSLVREVVDELHKPVNQRQHQPVSKVSDEHAVFIEDEDFLAGSRTLFYFIKNICLKITYQGEQVLDSGPFLQNGGNISGNRTQMGGGVGVTNTNNSGLDNSYMTGSQQQNKNPDPFQNVKWKTYGREFLSLDVIFDTLYLLSKPDATHKLRVPISAAVDYKGFRAVAVAAIPIQPQLGPSIGFYTDGKYVPHDMKLKQELVYVGDVLNLKENRINQKGQGAHFEAVPVSYFLKVYNYQQPESRNKGKDPDTPTKKSQEFHFTELHYLEEPYYVLKTAEIFPYDCDQSEHPRRDRFLRPEFVCSYERPLKADARKEISVHVAKDTKAKDDDVSWKGYFPIRCCYRTTRWT